MRSSIARTNGQLDPRCSKQTYRYVDIGASGAGSDGGVFGETDLKEAFEDRSIGMPEPDPLSNDDKPMPYFIVGDNAFPLKT